MWTYSWTYTPVYTPDWYVAPAYYAPVFPVRRHHWWWGY